MDPIRINLLRMMGAVGRRPYILYVLKTANATALWHGPEFHP